MGKKWVYVLHNIDNEYNDIYIGETIRLYRRLNEHLEGCGAKNTTDFYNVNLIGLYDVIKNNLFITYQEQIKNNLLDEINNNTFDNIRNEIDNNDIGKTLSLYLENRITERYMYMYKDYNNYNISGGKYTKGNYIKDFNNIDDVIDRPLCKCNLPCEVFLSKNNDFWFKCPLSNTNWMDFTHENFEIPEHCNFFEKYNIKNDI